MKSIEKMKRYHSRMTTLLNELEVLEYEEHEGYDELSRDYSRIVQALEMRRETLQKRGRHL